MTSQARDELYLQDNKIKKKKNNANNRKKNKNKYNRRALKKKYGINWAYVEHVILFVVVSKGSKASLLFNLNLIFTSPVSLYYLLYLFTSFSLSPQSFQPFNP